MEAAFTQVGATGPVYCVSGGAEAVEYLKGVGQYADRKRYPFPSLLLLDLKMAKMNGFEFLHHIRSYPNSILVPTIVFTSSENMDDLRKAYLLGANSYLVKSNTFEGLCDQLKFIYGYWMRVRIPPIDAGGRLVEARG
jgi:CheY-like chemotaxis protein